MRIDSIGDFMKVYDYTRLNEETEAVLSSDSPANSDEFNSSYREWRNNENNPFTFKGKRSRKLHTYVDGVGLKEKTSAEHEKTALKNICILITSVMFAYELAENVLILPVILIMKALGVEISYSFHVSTVYGNQYAVLFVFLIESLLKLFLPAMMAWRVLKIPAKTCCPLRAGRPWASFSALSTACLGFVLMSGIRILMPANMFSSNNMNETYLISQNMTIGCKIIFLIFNLIAVPVLMELLFHGALFQALRQFGVSFAVIMTGLLNALVIRNPFSFGTVFITSVIAGYGIWQSGSILTGIFVHIEVRTLSYLLFWHMDTPSVMGIGTEYLFGAVVLAAGLLGSLLLSGSKKRLYTMKDYETFLPMKEKLKYTMLGSPLVAIWILFAILLLLEVFV